MEKIKSKLNKTILTVKGYTVKVWHVLAVVVVLAVIS